MWLPPDRQQQRQRDTDRETDDLIGQAIAQLAAAAALAVLWPFGIVAAAAFTTAWLTGMHPARLLAAARASSAMTAVWLLAATAQAPPWEPGRAKAWALLPYHQWRQSTADLIHHTRIAAALLAVAPVAVPAGIAIGAGIWAWRCHQMTHGLMGETALATVSWDDRQWRRETRTAARDARQPGRVPPANPKGVPVGTVIRVIRARWSRVLVIPLPEFARHMVIVGASGSGKTTLMIRLWAAWYAASAAAARRPELPAPRPLLVVIDGKGGHDSIARAWETYTALTAAGAARIGVWPRHALNMWDIGPRELSALLHQLVEHGDGAASYYADISQAAIRLAVHAPAGPPRSSEDFLDRLSPGWLERAYAEGRPSDLEQVRAAKKHLGDIVMRYTVLLDRLGGALDGGSNLEDADAWYCILEGTAEPSVAEAQAMALIELVARADRSSWPPTTTAPCPAESPCPTSTSAAGP